MINTLVPTFDNSFIAGPAFSGKTRLMFDEVTCLLLHHLNPALQVLDQFAVHAPPGLHVIVIETELYDEAMTDLFRSTILGHGFSPDDPRIEAWLNDRFTWLSKEDNFRFNTPTDKLHGQEHLVKVIRSFTDDFTGDGGNLDDFRLVVYVDSLRGVGDPGIGKDIEKFQQVERELREIEEQAGCRIAWRVLHHDTRAGELSGGEQLKGWARFTVNFKEPLEKQPGYCYLHGAVTDHDTGSVEIGAAMLTQVDPETNRPVNIRFTKEKVTRSPDPGTAPGDRGSRRRKITLSGPKSTKPKSFEERLVEAALYAEQTPATIGDSGPTRGQLAAYMNTSVRSLERKLSKRTVKPGTLRVRVCGHAGKAELYGLAGQYRITAR